MSLNKEIGHHLFQSGSPFYDQVEVARSNAAIFIQTVAIYVTLTYKK